MEERETDRQRDRVWGMNGNGRGGGGSDLGSHSQDNFKRIKILGL